MSIAVSSSVWRNSKQDGTTLLLLLAIADLCDSSGECWPSVATLAQRARISERQAQRLLRRLAAAGEIAVASSGRVQTHNRYRVALPIAPPLAPVTPGAGNAPMGDIQHPIYKEEEPLRIRPDEVTPEIPPELVPFDAELRGLPGYDPDHRFLQLVAELYAPILKLEEQAIRIRGWLTDPSIRKARGRICSRAFILSWLRRETHGGPATAPGHPNDTRPAHPARKEAPHHGSAPNRSDVGRSGLERFG